MTVRFLVWLSPSFPLAKVTPVVLSVAEPAQLPDHWAVLLAETLSQVTVTAEMGTVEQPGKEAGAVTFTFQVLLPAAPLCVHRKVAYALGDGFVSGSDAAMEMGFGVAVKLETLTAKKPSTMRGKADTGWSGSGQAARANPAGINKTDSNANERFRMASPVADQAALTVKVTVALYVPVA